CDSRGRFLAPPRRSSPESSVPIFSPESPDGPQYNRRPGRRQFGFGAPARARGQTIQSRISRGRAKFVRPGTTFSCLGQKISLRCGRWHSTSLARRLLNPHASQRSLVMRDLARRLLLLVLGFCLALPPIAAAQSQTSRPSPFIVPAGLEPAVEFWKKVFAEVSLSQLIYFDPADMSRIYEIVEVGEENRSNQYIDSERARIAAANGVDIERVKAQRGIKERTAAGIKRSGRYIARIQEIFRERGLPAELSYLPIVESSYEMSARSSV